MRILLDMDGVLCDFVGAVLKLFDRSQITITDYAIHPQLGISRNKMWAAIDAGGFQWWADLEPLPHAVELLTVAALVGETSVATSTSVKPHSASGKVAWLQRHIGTQFRNYMIGPPKHLMARPDTVLIDDCDDNCQKFQEHGGLAIVFPQPWNAARAHCPHAMTYVRDKLGLAKAAADQWTPKKGTQWNPQKQNPTLATR